MELKILHIGICTGMNGLTKQFRLQSSEYREINSGHQSLNNILREDTYRPDLVFMQIQCENVIRPEIVQAMRDRGSFVINWNGDMRDQCPPWMIELPVDVSCFTNMRDVYEMRAFGKRAEWLEIGYDPEIYHPDGEVIRTYPIVFFGNNAHRFPMSQFRQDMCFYLKRKFPGQFGVYGIHAGSDGNFNTSQHHESAAYRFAKIAINVSHYEIERYSSDRMLRILGTGTAICLAKWYPDMPYEDGVHLRVWRTLEELESLIHYYLHPDSEPERLKIVERGRQYVLSTFTFEHQVRNVIKLYEESKG